MSECLLCGVDCADDYCRECLDAIADADWESVAHFEGAHHHGHWLRFEEPIEWDVVGGL